MPVFQQRIHGGRIALIFRCEVCGADAAFGFGVGSIRKAAEMESGKELGLWACAEHRDEVEAQSLNRNGPRGIV